MTLLCPAVYVDRKEETQLLSHSDEIAQDFHLIPFSPDQTQKPFIRHL